MEIRPAPTEEEAAAIVAAVEVLRARPVADDGEGERTPAWRFAGRWWRKPVPMVRDRPYWTPSG
jgi:hypothetical protein